MTYQGRQTDSWSTSYSVAYAAKPNYSDEFIRARIGWHLLEFAIDLHVSFGVAGSCVAPC